MRLQKVTSAWFSLPGDNEGAKFEITHLRSGEITAIMDASVDRRVEFRESESGEQVPVSIVDNKHGVEREKTVVKAIIGWENIFDSDGIALECTDENKIRLCRELSESDFISFVTFINNSRKELAAIVEKSKADTEKK